MDPSDESTAMPTSSEGRREDGRASTADADRRRAERETAEIEVRMALSTRYRLCEGRRSAKEERRGASSLRLQEGQESS